MMTSAAVGPVTDSSVRARPDREPPSFTMPARNSQMSRMAKSESSERMAAEIANWATTGRWCRRSVAICSPPRSLRLADHLAKGS